MTPANPLDRPQAAAVGRYEVRLIKGNRSVGQRRVMVILDLSGPVGLGAADQRLNEALRTLAFQDGARTTPKVREYHLEVRRWYDAPDQAAAAARERPLFEWVATWPDEFV